MSLMNWTVEQHGTNVVFADSEHQDVFRNLNILYDLRMEGAGNPILVDQLNILLNIVAAHFDHEELEMRTKNFVGYEGHKAEHVELLNTCWALRDKVGAGELDLSIRLCHLIKNWFDSHIPEFDRAYAEVLNS
jgi:hemerythrin